MLISIHYASKWIWSRILTDRGSRLKRGQLSDTSHAFPRGGPNDVPRGGWVRTLREALGMSQAQLAARAGISRATVQKLELAEARRRITLDSLDRLAAALGCHVAIALVPRDGSLEEFREREASAKAEALLKPTEHSMKLEGQGVSTAARQRLKQNLVESLLKRSPRKLWQ